MTGSPVLVEVRILGMPLDVYRKAAEHSDELRREFALIQEHAGRDVPRRLLDLMAQLNSRFSGFTIEQQVELDRAIEGGAASLDLVYRVPLETRQAVIELGALLDEADDFCREGDALLTLATPPDALAFRQWFLAEFVRQIEGEAPLSWMEYQASDGAPDRGPGPP